MPNSIENLKQMRSRLELVQQHLPRFGSIVPNPPILDTNHHHKSGFGSKASEKDGQVSHNASIPGLRAFQEYVRHDIAQIDLFFKRHAKWGLESTSSTFSTNAPYLIAVWNELVRAPQPIAAVDKTFKYKNSDRRKHIEVKGTKILVGTKIDIVAEYGRRWIRVNTIKNSRLLAEFREHDSYLTSSDEEEESSECSTGCHCLKPGRDELNNSLIQMGRSLVAAAESQSGIKPKITLRLTRLELDSESLTHLQEKGLKVFGDISRSKENLDPRISRTIIELLDMDIEVIIGKHDFFIPQELERLSLIEERRLVPSQQVNLDLSAVIALVSDMTHAPLPVSVDDAFMRFIPTPAERARTQRRRLLQKTIVAQAKTLAEAQNDEGDGTNGRSKSATDGRIEVAGANVSIDADDSEGVHSRALASQVLREMESSLLNEIAFRMRGARPTTASSVQVVSRFWASKEVRDRCLRIVDKIGGPRERRRAAALFYRSNANEKAVTSRKQDEVPHLGYNFLSEEDAIEAYWLDSRHSRSLLPGLVPLRVIEEDDLSAIEENSSLTDKVDPFWDALDRTSTRLLASGSVSHPRDLTAPLSESTRLAEDSRSDSSPPAIKIKDDVDDRDEIARAAVIQANTKLTAHTVETLAHGTDPCRHWTTLTANRGSVREILRECSREDTSLPCEISSSLTTLEREHGNVNNSREEDIAAIWILEPRSLAEGMRGDFVPC